MTEPLQMEIEWYFADLLHGSFAADGGGGRCDDVKDRCPISILKILGEINQFRGRR
jgi:hypothetical protein